ncbi:hypothetical protein [Butyrivibrio sp. MB2005]|uniref:hypothetical protein n=1 Tax=Butyrivibrio sp. MB2005 TaxID=1280678 RepID=UPI000423ADB3|nr:hypothetical protein [Butyrivibrio sp. MB2005]
MEDYRNKLEVQLKQIEGLISKISEQAGKYKNLPDKYISVSKSNGLTQYYWVDKKTKRRKYAKQCEIESLRTVAQRDYNENMRKKLCNIKKNMENFLSVYDIPGIEEIYNRMSDARKELIVPIIEPREAFIEKWKNVEYEPMGFEEGSAEFYSDNGIRVRSKSELMIANTLEKMNIPYRYEYPTKIKLLGNVRPDFTCLNVRTGKQYIWEHFGRMDSLSYANKNVFKIDAYMQTGYFQGKNMIMTFETSQHPISSATIKSVIEQYLI